MEAVEQEYGQQLFLEQQDAKREAEKKLAVQNVQPAQEAAKKLTARSGWRLLTGISAATIVGLVVSWATLTFRFFAGNIFHKNMVPKLEFWKMPRALDEGWLWLGLSVLGFGCIIVGGVIIMLVLDPSYLGRLIWESIKNWWGDWWSAFWS